MWEMQHPGESQNLQGAGHINWREKTFGHIQSRFNGRLWPWLAHFYNFSIYRAWSRVLVEILLHHVFVVVVRNFVMVVVWIFQVLFLAITCKDMATCIYCSYGWQCNVCSIYIYIYIGVPFSCLTLGGGDRFLLYWCIHMCSWPIYQGVI